MVFQEYSFLHVNINVQLAAKFDCDHISGDCDPK
jgi:hypothetical protein